MSSHSSIADMLLIGFAQLAGIKPGFGRIFSMASGLLLLRVPELASKVC
jgi:hypothetical protein